MGIESVNIFSENISKYLQENKTLKNATEAFKKEYLTKILEDNGWNQTKAARVLGIQRTYVIKLINELDIRRNK